MSKYNRYVVLDKSGDFAQSYSIQLNNIQNFNAEQLAKWCGFVIQGTVLAEYEAEGELKYKKIWNFREYYKQKYNREYIEN